MQKSSCEKTANSYNNAQRWLLTQRHPSDPLLGLNSEVTFYPLSSMHNASLLMCLPAFITPNVSMSNAL